MKTRTLDRAIVEEGFAFLRARELRPALAGTPADWERFAASWEDLRLDSYRPERDRLRRHAVLSARPGGPSRLEPPQPHYQAPEYNSLYGGVERRYEPVEPGVHAGPVLRSAVEFGRELFDRLRPGTTWRIELHQVRIVAAPGAQGKPTPEGVHRDGVDYVLVMLVRRENVRSGTTTVHDSAGRELGSFTLSEPGDAALVDDARVLHGVTPIEPLDPARPAFRDVLIATFAAWRGKT